LVQIDFLGTKFQRNSSLTKNFLLHTEDIRIKANRILYAANSEYKMVKSQDHNEALLAT